MTAKRTSQRILLALIAWLVCLTASSAAAQDTMGRAKELCIMDLAKLREMAKEKIEEKKEEDDEEIKKKHWVK